MNSLVVYGLYSPSLCKHLSPDIKDCLGQLWNYTLITLELFQITINQTSVNVRKRDAIYTMQSKMTS